MTIFIMEQKELSYSLYYFRLTSYAAIIWLNCVRTKYSIHKFMSGEIL